MQDILLLRHYIFLNPFNLHSDIKQDSMFIKIKNKHDTCYVNNEIVKYWGYKDIIDLLNCYDKELLKFFLKINPLYPALLSDIARMLILYKYGGIYHDLKYTSNLNMINFLKNNLDKKLIICRHPAKNKPIISNIISLEKNHPFLDKVLQTYKYDLQKYYNKKLNFKNIYLIGTGIFINEYNKIKENKDTILVKFIKSPTNSRRLVNFNKDIYQLRYIKWQETNVPLFITYKKRIVKEFVPIVLWKNDTDLYNIIKNEFNIVDTFSFSFSEYELREKLKQLYYPHKIKKNDSRIKSESIKIVVLEIEEPIYKIASRKEHKNKPLNQSIIKFKEKTRKKYNHTFFHSADFLNESQHTFKVFNIEKYITNELFINIGDLRAKIWLNKFGDKYCFKNITETPHYLYLNQKKECYEKYVSEIDDYHNTSTYNSLITSINSDKINVNNIIIPVIYNTDINKYVILDGLHRTCIYLNNNINYIKCRLINENQSI